jgi:hypothetical protein
MYTLPHKQTHIHIYIYAHIHTYMHAYTHTYIHTNDRTIYGQGMGVCDALFSPPLELPRRIVPRLTTENALYWFRAPITHLSCTHVHFRLIIEDRVCYLMSIGKHALLVPSRLHYCDDSCFTSSLFADFTQCRWVALLQRSCCREIIFTWWQWWLWF